jgi:hypothetical protein
LCGILNIALRYLNIILITAYLSTLTSCERIKKKGGIVVDKAKETVAETKKSIGNKKNQVTDRIFPIYNSDKADTEFNRKRFKEHLQVDLTDDIKDIYAYGDFLGIDYKVLIAFTCDQDDDGLLFLDEFKWWDKDKIEVLEPFKVGKEQEYWQYLWYDPKTKQAFYEEFSL